MTLVDTNVLLDLVTDDPSWADWSIAQLEAASLEGPLLINDVVYAELAVRYDPSRLSIVFWTKPAWKWRQFLVRRFSSPEKCSRDTAGLVDREPACCPISSSVPTQQLISYPC